MTFLTHLIEQYGLLLVFANVLLEQLGAPLPAYPTLILTAALAQHGQFSSPYSGRYALTAIMATAVVAALIADYIWFRLGRRYGRQVLSLLCRISLSPDSCVRQTELVYTRFGAPSLLVAKFIPGFASIASALAGALGTRTSVFLLFDAIGASIWVGLGVFLGSLFSDGIDGLLGVLQTLGLWGGLLVLVGLMLFIGRKWWQRKQFMRTLRMARISVAELEQLLRDGVRPTIVDVRSPMSRQTGRIPGATTVFSKDIGDLQLDVGTESEIIVYCACPNEASAAIVAKQLMARGYSKVRPLSGGIDAWIAAGYVIEAA